MLCVATHKLRLPGSDFLYICDFFIKHGFNQIFFDSSLVMASEAQEEELLRRNLRIRCRESLRIL